jgi:malonyl-CoA decarboxylase
MNDNSSAVESLATIGHRAGLFDRTVKKLRKAWSGIKNGRGPFFQLPAPSLPAKQLTRLREQIRECLEARGGEVSARTRAAHLGETYLSLNRKGRLRFLTFLARDFGVERAGVDQAIETLREVGDDAAQRIRAENQLRDALIPARVKLLTQFNALPEGIHFLVDMRAELLSIKRKNADIRALEQDLKRLLTSWFDVGFLELRRITWDSPASLLEKLIAYEAVHSISGWDDLKNRLGSDRRVFAFFHPRMPDEPLIFVQVALVNGIADNIQDLLDKSAATITPESADTAIFYSISNAQSGLAGISFGDFLIKKVVNLLRDEFPGLRQYATLSPIPGFRKWLDELLEPAPFSGTFASDSVHPKTSTSMPLTPADKDSLESIFNTSDGSSIRVDDMAHRQLLLGLCAHYLIEVKRRPGVARDPVANFHLSNGARIERLNWRGNSSDVGLKQSAGIMVNYLYQLDAIERNHEAYHGEGAVQVSTSIRSLQRDSLNVVT